MVKIVKYNPRIEATRFVKMAPMSRIPYLSREATVYFIDTLYNNGAMSVEVSKVRTIRNNWFLEMYVRVFDYERTDRGGGVREILKTILNTNPFAVEETKTRIFRVEWKLEENLGL
jgi:hypothetical protein